MIILNGEPFTRFNLRSLYPHAHQIIVVEGATAFAAEAATAEGHSSDETLDILHEFQRNEDPENKLTIVTAETELIELSRFPWGPLYGNLKREKFSVIYAR